jgi:hypothetical protein
MRGLAFLSWKPWQPVFRRRFRTPSMPEVAGDAAMLVSPYSVDDMAPGLNIPALNEDERAVRIRLGRERARRTWIQPRKRLGP